MSYPSPEDLTPEGGYLVPKVLPFNLVKASFWDFLGLNF